MFGSKACMGKARLGWFIGSCIGFVVLVGLQTTAELSLKSKPQMHDDEQLSKDVASAAALPRNMRSMVACGLLLLVMLKNIKAMIDDRFRFGKSEMSAVVHGPNIPGRNFGSVVKRVIKKTLASTDAFVVYTLLTMVVIGAYQCTHQMAQAHGLKTSKTEWKLFVSVTGEGFGILWLRSSIRKSRNAQGISAKCVALFAILYLDTAFTFPATDLRQLDVWACKVLEWVLLGLVLDVLYSILVTYRRSYQKELDVFPVKTLVCICAVVALMYQPMRYSHKRTSLGFTFRIYVDTFALVPQVVMMSLQERPVLAPIAHFVAVNAASRAIDLTYWLREYRFFSGPLQMSFSGWLIIVVHVASLLVVADFFFYYVKAWIASRGRMVDVHIPLAIEV